MMNLNRETLILLGNEQNPSKIPAQLLQSYGRLFTVNQQDPATPTYQSKLDSNVLIQFANFSQGNTPNLSAQNKLTQQSQTVGQKKSKQQSVKTFFPQKWPVQKSNLSPFSYSKYTQFQSLTSRYWYYLDNDNNIQGPFTCLEMDNWYRKNLLGQDLLISFKSLELNSFIRFKDIQQESETLKCNNQIKTYYKRSKTIEQNKIITACSTPESKDSTDSNANSCQKQRFQVWGMDNPNLGKNVFHEFLWTS